MARMARAVAPGLPHHIIQRGNRRQPTFFGDDDYRSYLELMSEFTGKFNVSIWAYCLMPNHVHLIAVPESPDSLKLAIGEAHRRYTRKINFREGWRGHLWQGRFASFVMHESYLLACAKYIELNPVRAGLVEKPEEWQWSSALAHVRRKDDILVKTTPLLAMSQKPWQSFLSSDVQEDQIEVFRSHERTGRPMGTENFINQLESVIGRRLMRNKPGPKSKKRSAANPS